MKYQSYLFEIAGSNQRNATKTPPAGNEYRHEVTSTLTEKNATTAEP